jgi:hypothetical protein
MIANDQELRVTLERIARFQEKVSHLRRMETNPANYRSSAAGFLAEIDRMQLEVREYLLRHPSEMERAIPETAAVAVG